MKAKGNRPIVAGKGESYPLARGRGYGGQERGVSDARGALTS